MKDSFFYFLYKLGQKKLFFHLSYKYYELGLSLLTFTLSKYKFIDSIYLKGSYGKAYFIPFVSDLDFFIIGKLDYQSKQKLKKTFKLFGVFFPMISEYDFHDRKEALLLTRFGGVKMFDFSNWYLLYGESLKLNYIYHPQKYYLDLVHEIFFQFQWLFQNLKKRKKGYKYRSLVVKRQYNKICDYLNYMYTSAESDTLKNDVHEDLLWRELSNEDIILRFNRLTDKNNILNNLLDFYSMKLKDLDLSEIKIQPYFQVNLKLIDDGFEYAGHDYYFSHKNFELFYSTGALDTYILFKLTSQQKNKNLKSLFYNYYCARLLEGRINDHHNRKYAKQLISSGSIKHFDRFEIEVSERALNFINQDIVIMIYYANEKLSYHEVISRLAGYNTDKKKILLHIKTETSHNEVVDIKNADINELCLKLREEDFLKLPIIPIDKDQIKEFFEGANSIEFRDENGKEVEQEQDLFVGHPSKSIQKLFKYFQPLLIECSETEWLGFHILKENEVTDKLVYLLSNQNLDIFSLKYQLDQFAFENSESGAHRVEWPFIANDAEIHSFKNQGSFVGESLSPNKLRFLYSNHSDKTSDFHSQFRLLLGDKSPNSLRFLLIKIEADKNLQADEINFEMNKNIFQRVEKAYSYMEENAYYYSIYFYDTFDERSLDVTMTCRPMLDSLYHLEILDIPDLKQLDFTNFYLKTNSLSFDKQSFHKGFYKFIVYFKHNVSGPLILTSTNKRLYINQTIKNESDCVVYAYLPFDDFKLALTGDSNFLSTIEEIDCLKTDLLF